MAIRYMTEIRFTLRKPTLTELARLNSALKAIDYDSPPLTENGMELYPWRSPHHHIDIILGLLVRSGFPCEGFQCLQYQWEEGCPKAFEAGNILTPIPDDVLIEWNELYWGSLPVEQYQLEQQLNLHCRVAHGLSSAILELQRIVGLMVPDSRMTNALNLLCELQKEYVDKHTNDVENLRKVEGNNNEGEGTY